MKEALLATKRVQDLAEHVKGNEQATKQSLIGPLFTLLGYVCRLHFGKRSRAVWLPLAAERITGLPAPMTASSPQPGWTSIALRAAWDQARAKADGGETEG